MNWKSLLGGRQGIFAWSETPPSRKIPDLFHQDSSARLGTKLIAGRDFTVDRSLRPPARGAGFREHGSRELWGESPTRPWVSGSRESPHRMNPGGKLSACRRTSAMPAFNSPPQHRVPACTLMKNHCEPARLCLPDKLHSPIRSDRAGTGGLSRRHPCRPCGAVNPNLPVFLVSTMRDLCDKSLAATSVHSRDAGHRRLHGAAARGRGHLRRDLLRGVAAAARDWKFVWHSARSNAGCGECSCAPGLTLTAVGVVIGLAAAAGLVRLMSSLLFESQHARSPDIRRRACGSGGSSAPGELSTRAARIGSRSDGGTEIGVMRLRNYFFGARNGIMARSEEIESYVRIETDENIARGMPPAEAHDAARKKFGNITLVREEIYRMNTATLIDTLNQETSAACARCAAKSDVHRGRAPHTRHRNRSEHRRLQRRQ